jgi:hypothetical protein
MMHQRHADQDTNLQALGDVDGANALVGGRDESTSQKGRIDHFGQRRGIQRRLVFLVFL